MASQGFSQKGKPTLSLEGFVYTIKNTKICGTQVWRCSKRGCGGRAESFNGVSAQSKNHSCDGPSEIEVSRRNIMTAMKERAIGHETEPPSRVMDAVHRNFSIEATASTANDKVMKRNIRAWRRKVSGNHPEPKSLEEICIPPNLQKTQRGEDFVLFDTGEATDRLICFSTASNIKEMLSCDTIIIDGTFDIAPTLFSQLYILHGSNAGVVLPYVYCLLPSKTKKIYKKFLYALQEAAPDFSLNGKNVVVDYELGAIEAIKKIFPGATIQGCLFHLQQSIYRHVNTQLDHRYRTDPSVELKIRSLSALSFLPTSEVAIVFDILFNGIDHTDTDLIDLYTYFKKNYIGCSSEPARFPVELWSVHSRTLLKIPRTTNSAEAFHRRLQKKAPGSHPPLWNFLEILRNEQGYTERKLEKFVIPSNIPSKKPRYETLDDNLQKLVRKYSVGFSHDDKLKFVRGCAYSLAQIKRKQRETRVENMMPRLTPNFDALTQQLTL